MERPKTRGECANIPRPCPFASCRYNLKLDVHPKNGIVTINPVGKWSCALDVADHVAKSGKLMPEEEIAEILGILPGSVSHVILRGLKKVRAAISQ